MNKLEDVKPGDYFKLCVGIQNNAFVYNIFCVGSISVYSRPDYILVNMVNIGRLREDKYIKSKYPVRSTFRLESIDNELYSSSLKWNKTRIERLTKLEKLLFTDI